MAIEDFGSTVEEVQRKLEEILPLVDAGAQETARLGSDLATRGSDWQAGFTRARSGFEQDEQLAERHSTALADVQTALNEALETHSSELTSLTERAEHAFDAIRSAMDQTQADVRSRGEQMEANSRNLEGAYDGAKNSTREVLDRLTSIRQSWLDARDEFRTERILRANEFDESLQGAASALTTLQQTIGDSLVARLVAPIEEIEESASAIQPLRPSFANAHRDLAEVLSRQIESQIQSSTGSYLDQVATQSTSLQEYLDMGGEVDCRLKQSAQDLVAHSVETLREEVLQTTALLASFGLVAAYTPPALQGVVWVRRILRTIDNAL